MCNNFESDFQFYLILRDHVLGFARPKKYYSDKISRLRRISNMMPNFDPKLIGEENYFDIVETLKEKCDIVYSSANRKRSASKDYLVVIRLIYEMNTSGSAPRYTHYGEKRVIKNLTKN